MIFPLLLLTLFPLSADVIPKQLNISNSTTFHPFSYTGENGRPQGLLIDYWREIEKNSGIRINFLLTDWDASLEYVKTGKADIHAGLFKTKEREAYLDFTIPLKISLGTNLFIRNDLDVSSLFDIANNPVGVVNEGYEEYYVRNNYPKVQIIEFDNLEDTFNSLLSGKLSAFVADKPTAVYFLNKYEIYENFRIAENLYTEELFAAVPKGRGDLLEYLNYSIGNFSKETREQILKKWIQPVSNTPEWVLPLIAAIIVTITSFFILFYIFVLKRQVYKRTKDLEEISQTDFLTKLYNRQKIEEIFRKELYRLKRYNTSLSVIMIDIDNFKRVNDTEGHSAGDMVLKIFADLLTENIRISDSVGRWGGEEFLITCPDTDKNDAQIIAEKLRQLIENTDFYSAVKCTASIGVVEASMENREYEIFQKVDKALYKSKASGKNCVTVL